MKHCLIQASQFLFQSLVPLLSHEDMDINLSVIDVIGSLVSAYEDDIEPSEVQFVWAHLKALASPRTNVDLLRKVLKIVNKLFLKKISPETRKDMLMLLFSLIFHADPSVRRDVYELLGGDRFTFWKAGGMLNNALGILVLCLGDTSKDNTSAIAKHLLLRLPEVSTTKTFNGILNAMASGTISSTSNELVRYFDELCNSFFTEKNECRNLVEAITDPKFGDAFWRFWMADVQDSQLAHPDEYNFSKVSGDDGRSRENVPTSTAGKRRWYLSYLMCVLPCAGIPDPMLRRSAFEILKYLIRLKLPTVASAVLTFYFDHALDLAANSPIASIKLGAIDFVESCLLIFPRAIEHRLPQIRDLLRSMLVDSNVDIAHAAFRVYPLVFSSVFDSTMAFEFSEYLKEEVNSVAASHTERAGDPLVARLSLDGRIRVIRASILAGGALGHKSTTTRSSQELILFLKHGDSSIREAAVQALWALIPLMDEIQTYVVLWTLLPLYADPSFRVRLAFTQRLRKIAPRYEALRKLIVPHSEDTLGLATEAKWDDLLKDDAEIKASYKEMTELGNELENLIIFPKGAHQLPHEDDGFNLPAVSERLMQRMKTLIRSVGGVVPQVRVQEVLYFLQDLQKNYSMQGPAVLVLSEFCCQHESVQTGIIEMFATHLSADISPGNTTFIEACLVALRNVSEYSPGLFKQIVVRLTSATVPSEGEIVALFYTFDILREVYPIKAKEIATRCNHVVVSGRYSQRKRRYAVYLAAEASSLAGPEDLARTLDSVQTFVEQTDDEDTRKKVFACLGRVMSRQGAKHSVFKILLTNAKRIQTKAKDLVVEEGLMDFLLEDTQRQSKVSNAKTSQQSPAGTYEFLQGASSIARFPSTMMLHSSGTVEDATIVVPLNDSDPLNVQYYSSDRRRKFTKLFGLSESQFQTHTTKTMTPVLQVIEEKVSNVEELRPDVVKARESLYGMNVTVLVAECVKKYTSVAVDIADTMLQEIVNFTRDFDEIDVQNEDILNTQLDWVVRQLQMLSNLLFVMDGVSEKVPIYVTQLQEFIQVCVAKAHDVREELYAALENSFSFFNLHVEESIVSEQQYTALEGFRQLSEEATTEIIKSGKTEKFVALESKRNEMNGIIDVKSEYLRRLTTAALQACLGFGLSDQDLTAGFGFLTSLLDDPHRGVRASACDSISMIVKNQLIESKFGSHALLLKAVNNKLDDIVNIFEREDSELFRKKSDLVFLLSRFVPYTPSSSLRLRCLTLLVKLWRDPDSEVRATAIDAVDELGRLGLPEVLDAWKLSKDNSNAPSQGTQSTVCESRTPNLIQEVSSLIADREYLDKERLQVLLKFPFKQKR
ncbi:hypothetical protein HDU93_009026 [Gonapodya sp. JEL0774]|nr:hypothetical protein HDU93_009026 [Gonapodya sp. JEL0774]